MKKNRYTAVILAAGQGKRMNSKVQKQYLLLEGRPVIYYSLKAFEDSIVDDIILVTGAEEVEYCKKNIVEYFGFHKVKAVAVGGKERYHSVYCGLKVIGDRDTDYVLIHDGARPFVTKEIIERTLHGAKEFQACIAGMPVKDTIKIADENGFAAVTPQRKNVWMIQTPQTFSYHLIYEAYEKLMEKEKRGHPITVTDDAMVVETMCNKNVKLVEGSYQNIKITTHSDLMIAKSFCAEKVSGKLLGYSSAFD